MAFEATNADEAISTIEGGIPIDLLSLAISRKFVDVRDFGSGFIIDSARRPFFNSSY